VSDLLSVSPTRGTLLRLRRELEGFRSRHALLDRKREILVQELLDRAERARAVEDRRRDLFAAAHAALAQARRRMGSDRLEWIVLSPAARLDVRTGGRTVMGLHIPGLDVDVDPIVPPYGPGETTPALDEARRLWLEVLRQTAEAAAVLIAVRRLAAELRKTRRQVNALESRVIPRHARTIAHIAERLEEDEREDIVRVRKVKETSNGGGNS
jgi:V/A-type H+-transporting ATPase subunit D